MFHGKVIHQIEEALSAAGVGHGLILRLLPTLALDAVAVAAGAKTIPQVVEDILADLKPPAA